MQPLGGTAILGVTDTGSFDGKHSEKVLAIYRRLSTGQTLLPPAVGFIFDREKRSETEIENLSRQGVSFLSRRLYENYLLNPQAIAHIMSNTEGFVVNEDTVERIKAWLDGDRWNDKRYFEQPVAREHRTPEGWLRFVHGAHILADIFTEFSEARVNYENDKAKYGEMLTEWVLKNSPNELAEILELIVNTISTQSKTIPSVPN